MKQAKKISRIIFLAVLAFHLVTAGNAAAAVISVSNGTGQVANFTSIQAAVDAANPGDEIVVKPGIYEENIAITKNLTLVSESGNFSDTILRPADSSQDILSIWSNGVSIKGFNITGSDSAGIHFYGVIDCLIENNKLSNNSYGIDLYMISSRNTLDNNEISDCMAGISLSGSWYNNLSNNTISNCSSGISLFDSPNNILENNIISRNREGISLTGESNGNTVINNALTLNEEVGLNSYESSNNLIYNNCFNNTVNIKSQTISDTNLWNTTKTEGINIAGGPYLGGNVWASPDGIPYPEGVRDADLDGILDSQYNIEGGQYVDYLPLKELKPVTLTVNNSTGQSADYTSIQAAIDNAFPGDTILIFPGVYEENVDVYVTNLTLTSLNEDTIVKAASSLDDIFYVIADGVTIRGLNITGPVDFPNAGIRLNGVKYCNIENNQLSYNYNDAIVNVSSENSSFALNNSSSAPGFGICLDSSSNNILGNNIISGSWTSILLRSSMENTLINNSASGSKYGVWVDSSSNNTLDGNTLSDNEIGAYLQTSSGNLLSNSTVSNNTGSGINLWESAGNTLSNSAASNNRIGLYVNSSSGNILTGNNALNSTVTGISVWNSTENKLIGNAASNSSLSISLHNSSNNTLVSNTVSNSTYGVWVAFSSNNNLSKNNASNNKFGIYLKNSTANNLSGNRINLNSRLGIYMGFSRGNVLNSNSIVSNSEYGLYILESGNSSIYNNYFDNTNNTYLQGLNTDMRLNTNLTQAKNILNGSYLGGNFWATPQGDGFSQTHADKNGDGICDATYILSEECIDYLPLAGSSTVN